MLSALAHARTGPPRWRRTSRSTVTSLDQLRASPSPLRPTSRRTQSLQRTLRTSQTPQTSQTTGPRQSGLDPRSIPLRASTQTLTSSTSSLPQSPQSLSYPYPHTLPLHLPSLPPPIPTSTPTPIALSWQKSLPTLPSPLPISLLLKQTVIPTTAATSHRLHIRTFTSSSVRPLTSSPSHRKDNSPPRSHKDDFEDNITKQYQNLQPPSGFHDDPEKRPFVLRYYEQDARGGEIRQLRDEKEFSRSLAGFSQKEVDQVQSSITDLEERMAALPTNEEMKLLAHEFAESIDDSMDFDAVTDKFTEFVKRLDPHGNRIVPELIPEDDQIPPAPNVPVDPYKPNNNTKVLAQIKLLNNLMSRAQKHRFRQERYPASLLKASWRQYLRVRHTLATGYDHVTREVWDLLWDLFSYEDVSNPNRMSRITFLARDLSTAKVRLSPRQQLLTIEAMFLDGFPDRALENWRRCLPLFQPPDHQQRRGRPHNQRSPPRMPSSNSDPPKRDLERKRVDQNYGDLSTQADYQRYREYLELGVRMYCQQQQLDQARACIDQIFAFRRLNNSPETTNSQDARILLPLILASIDRTTSPSTDDVDQTWTYIRMFVRRLGSLIRLDDYDQLMSYFLTHNRVEEALTVFVDMMTTNSTDNLQNIGHLPPSMANKFFLGKWLKRLIGNGELDSAFTVIKWMKKKGIVAAPTHVNGLIGAWQRQGGPANLARADEVAWEMIDSRLQFVEERSRDPHNSPPSETGDVVRYRHRLPPATIETFSLMAETYRLRGLTNHLTRLWDAFLRARIPYDTFLMNQLIDASLDFGTKEDGVQLYRRLVSTGKVLPDSHTFMALWKALDVNCYMIPVLSEAEKSDTLNSFFNPSSSSSSSPSSSSSSSSPHLRQEQIRHARATFAEMLQYYDNFPTDDPINNQLARKILHTFRRLNDVAGFVIALQALRALFHFTPTEALVMEMVIGTTRLTFDTVHARNQLREVKSRMDQTLTERRRALGLPQRPAKEKLARGEDLVEGADVVGEEGTVADEERGEELFEYLRVYFATKDGWPQEVLAREIDQARTEMGVHHFRERYA